MKICNDLPKRTTMGFYNHKFKFGTPQVNELLSIERKSTKHGDGQSKQEFVHIEDFLTQKGRKNIDELPSAKKEKISAQ